MKNLNFIEQINFYCFQIINASDTTSKEMLFIGELCAKNVILIFPMILIINWILSNENRKKIIFCAILSVIISLIFNKIMSLLYYQPRPFMIPVGNCFLFHRFNNSFPSNHMSISCTISFVLIFFNEYRLQGLILCIISFVIAWSRIYVGVHFPIDMIGSILVSLLSAFMSIKNIKLVNVVYKYIYIHYNEFYKILINKLNSR